MAIRPNKIDKRSSLYTNSARYQYIHVPADDIDRFFAATTLASIGGAGNTFTLLASALGGCASVYLALGTVSGTFNITVRVTGYTNQGVLTYSDVVLTQADTAGQTSLPFYAVTEVKYLTLNSGTVPAGVTLAAGVKTSDTTDFPTIGLPFSGVPEGAILGFAQSSGAAFPTYTYNETQGSITLSSGAFASSGLGMTVALNPDYDAYF